MYIYIYIKFDLGCVSELTTGAFGRIWKKAVVTYCRYYPAVDVQRLRDNVNNIKIFNVGLQN